MKLLIRIISIICIVLGLMLLTQTPGGIIFLIPGILLFVLSGRKSKKKAEQAKSSEPNVKASEQAAKSVSSTQSIPNTFIAFDLETTGVDINSSEIIQIAAVKVVKGAVKDTYSSYARPIGTIPADATAVNHITDNMVADAPDLKTVLAQFTEFIGSDLLIGYNIERFDIPILKRDLSAELNCKLTNDFIDVYQMTRSANLPTKDSKLSSVAKHFKLDTLGAHDALFDCHMTISCYWELCNLVNPRIKSSDSVPLPSLKRPLEQDKETRTRYLSSILQEYPDFTIKGKNICLSGIFDLGEEPYLIKTITEHGGTIKNMISNRVDFLIVGNRRNELWKYGAYGTKLEDANKLNEKGGHIVIVSERVLTKYLNDNQ